VNRSFDNSSRGGQETRGGDLEVVTQFSKTGAIEIVKREYPEQRSILLGVLSDLETARSTLQSVRDSLSRGDPENIVRGDVHPKCRERGSSTFPLSIKRRY